MTAPASRSSWIASPRSTARATATRSFGASSDDRRQRLRADQTLNPPNSTAYTTPQSNPCPADPVISPTGTPKMTPAGRPARAVGMTGFSVQMRSGSLITPDPVSLTTPPTSTTRQRDGDDALRGDRRALRGGEGALTRGAPAVGRSHEGPDLRAGHAGLLRRRRPLRRRLCPDTRRRRERGRRRRTLGDRTDRPDRRGGGVTADNVIGLVLALAIGAYLVIALLFPERL